MNAQQIQLVQSSFAAVAPRAESVATEFYARLFELDPSLRPLFKGDLQEQGRKLMQVITVAVNALEKLDQLVPTVRALGARHSAYGVKAKDYDTVGSALLATLASCLGNHFTPEVKNAWTETYMLLAGAMMDAAAKA